MLPPHIARGLRAAVKRAEEAEAEVRESTQTVVRLQVSPKSLYLAGVGLRANIESISHRCHIFEVAFVWELTEETMHFPLGCLRGGLPTQKVKRAEEAETEVRETT